MKTCFLFPGQGSQKANMGIDLLHISTKAKLIFESASDIFKKDLLKISQSYTEQELQKPNICQPLIVATNLAAFSALEEKGIVPNFLLGHSLGQYCALFAAKVLSLEDTFKILKIRVEAIENLKLEEKCGMCAIIGADVEKIEIACKQASSYVVCANYNSPTQTVVSGKINGIEEVVKNLEGIAKRCVFLNVSHAFHSEIMLPAAEEFEEKIKAFTFSSPKIAIYSNVTGEKIKKQSNIKSLLVKHLTNPVLFTKALFNLKDENVETFVELGEKTISSLVRKTLKNAKTLNVYNKNSFNLTLNFFEN